jgi:anti-anti-sigma factor
VTSQSRSRIDVEADDAVATGTLGGDIDLATVPRLEEARARALASTPSEVVIDLRGVRFIDSSGLKFLLETNRLARAGGWTLRLLRPGETAMRVFVLTGVDAYLPFAEA